MRRFGAVDIGTNSIKITVADCDDSGGLTQILDRVEITRLGKGVDKTGALAQDAMDKTLAALRRFVDEAREIGIAGIRAVGTSALRDAANGREFRDKAEQILVGNLEIITGEREATLAYLAAVSDPAILPASDAAMETFDVGGGSTELVYGAGAKLISTQSVNIGAVRLTERILRSESSDGKELEEAAALVDQLLGSYAFVVQPALIGIGGTAATICAMLHPKTENLHGQSVERAALRELMARLAAQTLDERKKTPGLDPLRADVIIAGMLIIDRIMTKFAAQSYILSLRGVRYGLLLEMARERNQDGRAGTMLDAESGHPVP